MWFYTTHHHAYTSFLISSLNLCPGFLSLPSPAFLDFKWYQRYCTGEPVILRVAEAATLNWVSMCCFILKKKKLKNKAYKYLQRKLNI